MDRRQFMNLIPSGAALAALLPLMLHTAQAEAEVMPPEGFKDVPGFNGKLKSFPLKQISHDANNMSRSNILWLDQGVSIPYHEHPAGELIYILEGAVVIDSTYENGLTESVRYVKGDVMWFPPHTIHTQEISESTLAFVYEPLPADFRKKG